MATHLPASGASSAEAFNLWAIARAQTLPLPGSLKRLGGTGKRLVWVTL